MRLKYYLLMAFFLPLFGVGTSQGSDESGFSKNTNSLIQPQYTRITTDETIEMESLVETQYVRVKTIEDEQPVVENPSPKESTSLLSVPKREKKSCGLTWKQTAYVGGVCLTSVGLLILNDYWASQALAAMMGGYNATYTEISPYACRQDGPCGMCGIYIHVDDNQTSVNTGQGGCNSIPIISCPSLNITEALETVITFVNRGTMESFTQSLSQEEIYYSWPAFGRHPSWASWSAMQCNRTAQAWYAVGKALSSRTLSYIGTLTPLVMGSIAYLISYIKDPFKEKGTSTD